MTDMAPLSFRIGDFNGDALCFSVRPYLQHLALPGDIGPAPFQTVRAGGQVDSPASLLRKIRQSGGKLQAGMGVGGDMPLGAAVKVTFYARIHYKRHRIFVQNEGALV
ncbi:hypothetical protein D3C76_1677000 [compost metagenome]